MIIQQTGIRLPWISSILKGIIFAHLERKGPEQVLCSEAPMLQGCINLRDGYNVVRAVHSNEVSELDSMYNVARRFVQQSPASSCRPEVNRRGLDRLEEADQAPRVEARLRRIAACKASHGLLGQPIQRLMQSAGST